MPIYVSSPVVVLSEKEFKDIAYQVMGFAFDVHRDLGTLFSEVVYKDDIAKACRKAGYSRVERELPVRVFHENFEKRYFVDLLVEGGALFEFKIREGLIEEDRAQTLNYLFVLEIPRGKLAALGGVEVQHRFVSTTLSHAERKRFSIDKHRWQKLNSESAQFLERFVAIVSDWGSFLELPLYQGAMTHFSGGEDRVVQEIAVIRQGAVVAKQKVHLLNDDTAFRITALEGDLSQMEFQLRRFLAHTSLRAIQWVNIYQHELTFTTLTP